MRDNQLHFNSDTGKVGRCRAEKGGFPFIDASDPNGGHYETIEEMDAYRERRSEKERNFPIFKTSSFTITG